MLVGLPGAGKTTLLHRLGLGELVTIIPTIGWNVETVERGGCSIIAWDLGVPDLPRPHLLSRYTYRKNGLVLGTSVGPAPGNHGSIWGPGLEKRPSRAMSCFAMFGIFVISGLGGISTGTPGDSDSRVRGARGGATAR